MVYVPASARERYLVFLGNVDRVKPDITTVRGPPSLTTNAECLKIAQRNQRASPLLRLPAELRNRIYDLAMDSQRPCLHEDRLTWDRLNLSRACRQLFAETAAQYFATKMLSVIAFLSIPHSGSTIRDFALLLTPSQKRAVLCISLQYRVYLRLFQRKNQSTAYMHSEMGEFSGLKKLIVSESTDWVAKKYAGALGIEGLEIEGRAKEKE